MSAVEEHKAGTFCWIELGTTDTGAARNYYKDLVGWSDAAEQDYVMLKLSGKEVGGLYELTAQVRSTCESEPLEVVVHARVDDTDDDPEEGTR